MPSTTGNYHLEWNYFQHNIASSFREFRKDLEFSDVTLVCEENQQIEAHRVILASCSPFFSTVLKRNKHSHPMIYMRGLKARHLNDMMDFIYYGEANVGQEDIDVFLSLGEDLKLKGLSKSTGDSLNISLQDRENVESDQKKSFIKDETRELQPTSAANMRHMSQIQDQSFLPTTEDYYVDSDSDASKNPKRTIEVDADISIDDLEVKKRSLMVNIKEGDFRWKCLVCGKMTKESKNNMTRHIESHITGLSFPCDKCDKVSRSKQGLKMHVLNNHKK